MIIRPVYCKNVVSDQNMFITRVYSVKGYYMECRQTGRPRFEQRIDIIYSLVSAICALYVAGIQIVAEQIVGL